MKRKPEGIWGHIGLVLATLLCTAALLAVCIIGFTVGIDRSAEPKKSYIFGFTIPTMNNAYCAYLESMLRALVEAGGSKMISLDPQYDQQKQISQIQDMIDMGAQLIFLCPINYNDITPALIACQKAGVPIVNYDCDVAQTQYVSTVVISDNYKAGQLCAEDIMRRMPEGCDIAIIDDSKAKSVVQRMAGFCNALTPAFNVIERVDSDGTLESAMPIMERLLVRHPEMDAVMCANDVVASGCVAAIQISDRWESSILVYGVDGSPDAKKLILDGKMTATVAQSPIKHAQNCYQLALKILDGHPVEKEVLVDTHLIDRDNIREFDPSGWQ